MEAYQAYYEKGRIIPIGNPTIPEGRRIIITVLDESVENHVQRRLAALDKFQEEIRAGDELTESDFDDIGRISITREFDI